MHSENYLLSPASVAAFFLTYYCLACWTYGLALPSGLFVPSLLAGAAYGKLWAYFVESFWSYSVNSGLFVVVGAASMLGGMARMTISLAVILIELTAALYWGPPIAITLFVARWTGNYFNEGLYDIHIHLKHWPILERGAPLDSRGLHVTDIIKPAAELRFAHTVMRAQQVYELLANTQHNGFPVVHTPHTPSPQAGKASSQDGGGTNTPLAGLVLRKHLLMMLYHKDLHPVRPTPFCRGARPESPFGATEPFNPELGQALNYTDMESIFPRFPTIEQIELTEDEAGMWMDLTPYMTRSPHILSSFTPVSKAYNTFLGLGLRHIVVVNEDYSVRGMLTRADLLESQIRRAQKDKRQEDSRTHEHSL